MRETDRHSKRGARGLWVGLAASLIPLLVAVPEQAARAAPAAPPTTYSRYMGTNSTSRHYDLGCALGQRTRDLAGTQSDLVILDYGAPVRFSDGSYGATVFGGSDSTTSQLAAAAEQFARGYYICTGSDLDSQLVLAVGTSNYGSGPTSGHGRAWAQMVNAVNSWLSGNSYSSQARAVGGSDMELGWNTPAVTRAWVDGYDSANSYALYDYGDAAGCKTDGTIAGDECGTSSYPGWTAEDVWYVSWGASPSWPVPEVYSNSGSMARQWKGLSLYTYTKHGGRMGILGALTQYQACKDSSCDSSIDNTPAQGWSQLWDALNGDSRTAASLTYSTDITWKN